MQKLMMIMAVLVLFSCKKQDKWLDVKSNKADITPVTLEDFQALLDNDNVMNNNYPAFGLLASDNYYVSYSTWASRQPVERNAYLWKPDIYDGGRAADWVYLYTMVEYNNIILDGISKIKEVSSNKAALQRIRGRALFYRSYAFYNLLQLFSMPYDVSSAGNTDGIPLRLSSDINVKSVRSTVEQSYQQVMKDLLTAKDLLSENVSSKLTPSRAATLALLARVSLTMKMYDKAAGYVTEALSLQGALLDFNNLDTSIAIMLPSFRAGNKEIIFYAVTNAFGIQSRVNLKVDSLLYKSYDGSDLRRTVFYKNNGLNGISYKGDYTGATSSYKFAGLATNELYLIRAECYARINKINEAFADLNYLLEKRWVTGTYILKNSLNTENLLATYPIPENEILLSGIKQNPR